MFENRKDAGIQLGKALGKYKNENPLVIGIPRGGIETAFYVAKELEAEMIAVVSRKLGYPDNPEVAMGAIAEDGSIYLTELGRGKVSPQDLEAVLEKEKLEMKRRIQVLRKGKELPPLSGKTILVVDDGMATGATLMATLKLCQNQNPKKIVVGVPIAGKDAYTRLEKLADEVLILEQPEYFQAVSQGYLRFSNLSDEETLHFIEQHEKTRIPK